MCRALWDALAGLGAQQHGLTSTRCANTPRLGASVRGPAVRSAARFEVAMGCPFAGSMGLNTVEPHRELLRRIVLEWHEAVCALQGRDRRPINQVR